MVPEAYVVTAAALFGSVFGSFLNVCIVRLPAGQSVIKPRSRCPRCGSGIAWYDNLPILSWIILRGRCRHCGQPIAVRYPLVEIAVAAVWGLAAWHYGVTLDGLTAAALGTILLGIGVTDASHYVIPDEYTLGGLALGLALSFRLGFDGFADAVVGAVLGFGLLLVVAWAGARVFGQEAMGGGDIKMMAMVGAFVGWKGVLLTLFGGALLGTVVFVPLSLRRRRLVPFGVFLAAAAAVAFVLGDRIINWYVALAFGG